MSVVRDLRCRAGLTQQALAALAGTSQSAIAAYETGRKSPRLATVERIATAVGLDVAWTVVPPLTRSDRRSLALHRDIAEAVRRAPRARIEQAQRILKRMRQQHPHASELLDRWDTWLRLPLEQLVDCMLDASMPGRDMRQVTPFAGALSARERARAYRRFRRGEVTINEARRV